MRPREKLIEFGADSLTDVEMVSLFLGTGSRGVPVHEMAQALLQAFDGLRGLMQADWGEMQQIKGMGPAKFAQMAAAFEMSMRYLRYGLERGEAMTDPSITRRFLLGRLRSYPREVFACMFLDNQHRLIAYEEMFFGTIDGASVHPREVVRRGLELNAAAVVFAHNHPSGVAEPSQADRRITTRLQAALDLIDIRVLDHMVVGDTEVVSFAERGLL